MDNKLLDNKTEKFKLYKSLDRYIDGLMHTTSEPPVKSGEMFFNTWQRNVPPVDIDDDMMHPYETDVVVRV